MSDEFDQLDRLIIERQVLRAFVLIRELFGCSLQEAIEFLLGSVREASADSAR